MQVVLEYQWTSSRDLISDVLVQSVQSEQPAAVSRQEEDSDQVMANDVYFKSVLQSLSAKGFDIEPEQRISFRDHDKALNVYIGKASDQAYLDGYKLPRTAFQKAKDGNIELTLLIREAGSLSG